MQFAWKYLLYILFPNSGNEMVFVLSVVRRNVKIDLVLECAARHGFDWEFLEICVGDVIDDDQGGGNGWSLGNGKGVYVFRPI